MNWAHLDNSKDFPAGSVVKNLPADSRDAGGMGLTSGSGRSLEKVLATQSSILAWKIPWTEEPGGLQSMGSHSVLDTTERLSTNNPE